VEYGSEKLEQLRKVGLPVDALNERLVAQLNALDESELAALASIKGKLNAGLDDRLKAAADTVGGFVW
jgi:hypothetical protein